MKLLYLTNVQIPAGNAQNLQIQAMSKSFSDSLKNNFLLVSPWNQTNEKITSTYQWRRIKIVKWFPRFLRQAFFLIKSRKIVKEFQPDIIYTRDVAVAWFFRRLGFKTVYEIHKPFTTMIGNIIFKRVCKKIKIIAISQTLKDFIVGQYGLNSNMILVAHDGVDLKSFDILENKEQLREKYFGEIKDKFIVLYTGSQERGKGVENIVEVAPRVSGTAFVIMGGLEDEQGGNLIFKKKINQKEIPNYLKAADLLVLPMNKDLSYGMYSSPLKLFEYMASGTPVLASDFGAIKEVLSEKNSFLFDPEDANDLVEKIKYISDNNEKAIRIAKESLKLAKEYTWEKRAEKVLNFL